MSAFLYASMGVEDEISSGLDVALTRVGNIRALVIVDSLQGILRFQHTVQQDNTVSSFVPESLNSSLLAAIVEQCGKFRLGKCVHLFARYSNCAMTLFSSTPYSISVLISDPDVSVKHVLQLESLCKQLALELEDTE
uniref:Uncharacterized protein n=1 Tax=Timspurckia oligopyrenoides TaxID=708627 RepID=A0A7S0ZHG8_9RHOD|mmetsp:Transcript_5463/g.9628  ORF Transcript_5463/g.9628 Transcript_5463/m.9628 type:complete len:137 (+) Transcript_5463:46-456(+)